jgi:hypothetical protein
VNEDESLSIYDIPLRRWIDHAYGYTLMQDDQDDGFYFQLDFLPPTHLHEFHFTIDYISIYAHDNFVLDLYFLFHIIKHKGRYYDEMINQLHWLYEFT